MDGKEFWEHQSSSFGRYESDEFYADKADEHAQLMRPQDRDLGAVDLGCGAGELLFHLMTKVNIRTGLDYSESMLSEARIRLGDDGPELKTADVFDYLGDTTHPVWLTTGALNQYLKPDQIRHLLELFHANPNAQSFYLFDCVDPIRYRMMSMGISFRQEQLEVGRTPLHKKVIRFLRRIKFLLSLVFNRPSKDCTYMGSPQMGYGYYPKYWLKLCNDLGVPIRIVSSRHYEYRYHVILNKN